MDLRTFNKSEKAYNPEEWEQVLVNYFEFMKTQYWNKADAIRSGDRAGEIIYIPTQTPLTRGNLCAYASISYETLKNYASNKPGYENHFALTTRALELIDNNQIEGAMVGAFNSNLVARIQGLADKKEVNQETTTKTIVSLPEEE
jgi:hypothetical protein